MSNFTVPHELVTVVISRRHLTFGVTISLKTFGLTYEAIKVFTGFILRCNVHSLISYHQSSSHKGTLISDKDSRFYLNQF